MIEATIRNYLLSCMSAGSAVPVYVEVPADPADTHIVIERTGGGLANHIRYATLAVQSIAPTMAEAAILHEQVISWMLDAITLDVIGSVDLEADYNFTDQSTKRYRYQAVFEIAYYAEV